MIKDDTEEPNKPLKNAEASEDVTKVEGPFCLPTHLFIGFALLAGFPLQIGCLNRISGS